MGYKDNLKYDVVVTREDGRPVFRAVASFMSHTLAAQWMESNLLHTPFTATEDDQPVWDMYYNGNINCLFHNPAISLNYISDLPDTTTKSVLVEQAKLVGQFDYALPQPWVDEVVEIIHGDGAAPKEDLYYWITRGTVWYYPKVNVFGRVSGRPVSLVKESEQMLVRCLELTS